MPKTVLREFKLTQAAISHFDQSGVFPAFETLNAFFTDKEILGRGTSVPTDIKQGLPVTRPIAEAFVSFLNANKMDAPSAIHQIISSSGQDPLGGIFEQVVAHKALPQNEKNDPSLSGLSQLGPAADQAIMDLEHNDPSYSRAYLDRNGSPTQFSETVNAYLGRLLRKDKALSHEDAVSYCANYMNEPEGLIDRFGQLLTSVNRNFIRYSLVGHHRIGLSCAFTITDEAFEATLRGERREFSHLPSDLVPFGNNIILQSFCEIPNSEVSMSVWSMRGRNMAAMLHQLALIIDPTNRRPIRYIAGDLIEANTKRLKSLRFRSVIDKNNKPLRYEYYNGMEVGLLEFDPTTRGYFESKAMMLVDSGIRLIRSTIDRRPISED